MTMRDIAQIIGIIGIACSLLSFQFKTRKKVMTFQITASAMFCLQLFMLGAITGACVDFISFIRTVIFSQNNKKWASSSIWLWVFVSLMIITGVFTWQNAWSILPIIGSILSTVAMWMKKPSQIRAISFFVGPCWLVYNLVHGAWTGALNEVFAMASILIGIIRYDIKKTKNT